MPHPKVKIADNSGNEVGVSTDGLTNRLKVDSDDGFISWATYPDFEVNTTATAISDGTNGTGASITDAKEVLIQADSRNSSYIMVGHSIATTETGSVGARAGIKLVGGEILILAITVFSKVFLKAPVSGQYVNVAYFK